jgi:hypothetical protein
LAGAGTDGSVVGVDTSDFREVELALKDSGVLPGKSSAEHYMAMPAESAERWTAADARRRGEESPCHNDLDLIDYFTHVRDDQP